MIFGEDRKIEMIGASVAGLVDDPIDQSVGDALALHFLDNIKLAELGRFAARFEREVRRADLGIADHPAVFLGEADREGRVAKLLLPRLHGMIL